MTKKKNNASEKSKSIWGKTDRGDNGDDLEVFDGEVLDLGAG